VNNSTNKIDEIKNGNTVIIDFTYDSVGRLETMTESLAPTFISNRSNRTCFP
jgi:hypothetical protein